MRLLVPSASDVVECLLAYSAGPRFSLGDLRRSGREDLRRPLFPLVPDGKGVRLGLDCDQDLKCGILARQAQAPEKGDEPPCRKNGARRSVECFPRQRHGAAFIRAHATPIARTTLA